MGQFSFMTLVVGSYIFIAMLTASEPTPAPDGELPEGRSLTSLCVQGPGQGLAHPGAQYMSE